VLDLLGKLQVLLGALQLFVELLLQVARNVVAKDLQLVDDFHVGGNLLAHEAFVELSALLGAELFLDDGQALLANLVLDGDPIELAVAARAAAGLARMLSLPVSGQVAGQALHLLAAGRVVANHALGKFTALVILAFGLGPFGDFDFVAAFAVDAGGDLLIG